MEGVDYAFHTDPAALYAAGKRFAMRYIGPGTDDKHLHAGERDQIWAAGLSIVLLAEDSESSALGGFAVGAAHARSARAAARALGAPDSAPIYYAVDFDVTAAQWPTVAAYFQGCGSVDGLGQVGIYGGIRAMQWAARDRVAAWFFQTYAWSGGAWFAGAHVEQYHNSVALAGGEVDLDRAMTENFGQWGPPGTPQEEAMIVVHVKENGGYYLYPDRKWLTTEAAVDSCLAGYGLTRANVKQYNALDDVRNAVGPIPGVDLATDPHGNIMTPTRDLTPVLLRIKGDPATADPNGDPSVQPGAEWISSGTWRYHLPAGYLPWWTSILRMSDVIAVTADQLVGFGAVAEDWPAGLAQHTHPGGETGPAQPTE